MSSLAADLSSDLRSSLYCKLWAIIWLSASITAFVGLAFITPAENANAINMRFNQEVTEIPFPGFRFRTADHAKYQFSAPPKCTHGPDVNFQLQAAKCEDASKPTGTCYEFNRNGNAVARDPKVTNNQLDRMLNCDITMTPLAHNDEYEMIAWEMVGGDWRTGDGRYASIWIFPNAESWILLDPRQIILSNRTQQAFHTKLVYHSGTFLNNTFHVTIIMDTFFFPIYYETTPLQAGWKAFSAFGGLCAALWVIATIILRCVNRCVPNNSRFLKSLEDTFRSPDYTEV